MPKTLTETIADFIISTSFESLSLDVVEMAKLSFLDWVGSVLAGSGEKPGKILLALETELGGLPRATILANGRRTSPLLACIINGGLSHVVELDDVHKASVLHPAATVIPAALAAAEMAGVGGRELITGIVVGYDVALRIGEAVTPSHYDLWHTTATCGTFGAAAAAGKILGLEHEQLVNALGNAGTQAAGLWQFLEDGAMSKHLHPGKAASNGMLAVLLARDGFTGARKILEGDKGFFKATSRETPEKMSAAVTQGLGQKYKILENCFKLYASCRHTHPTVDLIINLCQEHTIGVEEVEKIKVSTYAVAIDITGNYQPKSTYAAKFSLPFCVAQSMLQGKLGLLQFHSDYLSDPQVIKVMSKIELVADEELTIQYPEKWPAEVEIVTKRGCFRAKTLYPKGDPENPLERLELEEKFSELAKDSFAPEEINNYILKISQLEQLRDVIEVLITK